MILSFEHKGRELFFATGHVSGIQSIHAKKFRELLTALNVATAPADVSQLSWRLHGMSVKLDGHYSVTVQTNWRLTFRFVGHGVALLNYLDYH